MTIQQLLTVLFISLSCFVLINFALSLVLWKYSKHTIYKMIVQYWIATLFFFGFQFFFPDNPTEISFAYGAGIVPMVYVYTMVNQLFKEQAQAKRFIIFHGLALITTFICWQLDLGFTIMTLPLSISMSLPLLSVIKIIYFTHRKSSTLLQKMLAGLLFLWIPHCFTFAFFRMVPDAEFFGWITSYTLYDMMAILLPALALEESFKNEKERLEEQVNIRTQELKVALDDKETLLKDKETLLKVLVHDITNPLTLMRWYLNGIKKNPDSTPSNYLDKVVKSQAIIENIVKKVRILQAQPTLQQGNLTHICFQQCIDELKFVFEKALQAKNIRLEVIDESDGHLIKADQFSLTHNVLSNFLSNAIKFSFNDSVIKIHIIPQNDQLLVTIQDFGMGMKLETVNKITQEAKIESTQGTQGEIGSGLGLSIASTLLKNFGGKLEIISKEYTPDSSDHGTCIKLFFPLVSRPVSVA